MEVAYAKEWPEETGKLRQIAVGRGLTEAAREVRAYGIRVTADYGI
jgi:hypothetical protein